MPCQSSLQAVEGSWFAKLMLLVLLSKAGLFSHLVLRALCCEGPGAQPARHPACRHHGLVTTREPLAPRLPFAKQAS